MLDLDLKEKFGSHHILKMDVCGSSSNTKQAYENMVCDKPDVYKPQVKQKHKNKAVTGRQTDGGRVRHQQEKL